jgi:hypothetical protein
MSGKRTLAVDAIGSPQMEKNPQPREVTLLSSPFWIFEALKLTVSSYQRSRRPLSRQRLTALWRPNLADPIFVVGAPRSGTTFVGESLGAIRAISYHHEPILTKATARYVYDGRWDWDTARRHYRRVYRWLMRVHNDGDLRFAEKTPRNSLIMDFLAHTFPDAKFVHVVRDGRASAASHVKQPWLRQDQPRRQLYEPGGDPMGAHAQFWVEPERIPEFESTTDVHRCIWIWRRFLEAALKASRALPKERYCELRYEDLVTSSERHAELLLDFLGIRDERSRTEFRSALGQAHTTSLTSWREELSPPQLVEIEDEAGPLLRSLGYV